MTNDDINELLETVAVHIEWLGRSGTKARQHRVDNTQSADYLRRLVAVVRELGGRIEADQRVVAADPAPTVLPRATLAVIREWFTYHHGYPCADRAMDDLRRRLAAADPALDMPGPDTTEGGR